MLVMTVFNTIKEVSNCVYNNIYGREIRPQFRFRDYALISILNSNPSCAKIVK